MKVDSTGPVLRKCVPQYSLSWYEFGEVVGMGMVTYLVWTNHVPPNWKDCTVCLQLCCCAASRMLHLGKWNGMPFAFLGLRYLFNQRFIVLEQSGCARNGICSGRSDIIGQVMFRNFAMCFNSDLILARSGSSTCVESRIKSTDHRIRCTRHFEVVCWSEIFVDCMKPNCTYSNWPCFQSQCWNRSMWLFQCWCTSPDTSKKSMPGFYTRKLPFVRFVSVSESIPCKRFGKSMDDSVVPAFVQ